MFIIAHLDIIGIAVLMAFPYYFFNRYLIQRINPGAGVKRMAAYFVIVFITALLYSFAGVLLITRTGLVLR